MLAPDSETVTEKRWLSSRSRRKVADEGVGLAGGCAVADGDGTDVVFDDQRGEGVTCSGGCVLGSMKVQNVVCEELSGLVDDGDLAAGAEARVNAQDRDWPGGRGEEEVLEVIAKDLDRVGVGALFELEA